MRHLGLLALVGCHCAAQDADGGGRLTGSLDDAIDITRDAHGQLAPGMLGLNNQLLASQDVEESLILDLMADGLMLEELDRSKLAPVGATRQRPQPAKKDQHQVVLRHVLQFLQCFFTRTNLCICTHTWYVLNLHNPSGSG